MHSNGFITREAASAYIPLQGSSYFLFEGQAAATLIAPGIAATNAHNGNLVDGATVIGRSRDYDLMFFRTARQDVPPEGVVRLGASAIGYGHGKDNDVREAAGPVRGLAMPVLPRCPGCPEQQAFVYQAQGGPGFSGGPVFDKETGQLIGVTFGFKDGLDDQHPEERLMYAYDLARVFAELKKLTGR